MLGSQCCLALCKQVPPRASLELCDAVQMLVQKNKPGLTSAQPSRRLLKLASTLLALVMQARVHVW